MNVIIDKNLQIVNDITEIYSHAAPHKIRGLIEKHFIPTNEEKKNNAEIPTPVALVDEMLNVIPEEFWTTPHKVFEPCCGKGNFVLGIFDKFYEGLKEKYVDEIERCEVIMTKCLYYADLTTMNVFITTEILKCHIQSYTGLETLDYSFNSYTGDTLKTELSGFDAVIGNPPYNDASGNKGKGHTLWTLFVEYSLSKWLNINGYLLFVTPSLWRQPKHPLQKIMKEKQIMYLEIHDEKDGFKTFRCSTRYDIYLINNKEYEENTKIKTQKKELISIDLRLWDFIPNYNFELLQSIINSNDKIEIIESRSAYGHDKKWVSKIKNDIFKYPVVYSVNRDNKITSHFSSTDKNGHFGKSKVIFGSGATGFIIDGTGEYGLTQWAVGIVDDIENLENIKNALCSSKFKDVILSSSVSKAEINRKILQYFKKDFWKEFI